MEIIEAKNSGFCFGVRSAVETALSNASPNTYTYGDVIHNEIVLDKLKGKGVKSVENLDEIPDGATVIIRSHGVKKSVYDEIERRNLKLVDATCPFVKKIHAIVSEYYEKGYKIYVVGNPTHPEVIGINGWCNDEGVIVDENFDFESIENDEKACFVTQTTFSIEKYQQLLKKIPKHRLKTVEIFDTICYTTVSRQNEAQAMAGKCTKILVIGSAKSSNTKKLVELSSSNSCTAYAIRSLDDLKKIKFSTEDIVGIIAGASAPDESITEVKKYMAEQFTKVENADFLAAVEKMGKSVDYKVGKRVKGKVISANENGISLSLDGKNDGFIPASEASIDGAYNPADYTADQELEVKVVGPRNKDTGCIPLSKKAIDEIKEADKIIDTIRNNERFELAISGSVEKGLTAKLGTYNVFIPASQVEEKFVRDLKKYVGKTLLVVALEIDDNKKKIVASHRQVVEADRIERENVFWANVVENMIVSGVVKRIAEFGAFVSVDGFDCLAHITDLSWDHIKKADEVLTVGESYEFVVLKADREKGRVSLGYKQLQPPPFVAFMEKNPVGSIVKGKVVSTVNFGVFVEVAHRIEGLVHVSEVAHNYVKDLTEIIKVGDEVDVKILSYDEEKHNINLSIKACLPEEEKPEKKPVEEKAEGEEKKARKPRKTEKAAPEEETEWSEDVANNPFAALLKNLDVDAE